jgi:hypothetical protein
MKKPSKPVADPARKQAVIYARVSSKEQEKEGFSIPGVRDGRRGPPTDG